MPAIELTNVAWAAAAALFLIFLGQWGKARRRTDKDTLPATIRGFSEIVAKWTKTFITFVSISAIVFFDVAGIGSALWHVVALDPIAGATAVTVAISTLQSVGQTTLTVREAGLAIALVFAGMVVLRSAIGLTMIVSNRDGDSYSSLFDD